MRRHHASILSAIPLSFLLSLYPKPANQHANALWFPEPVAVQFAFAEADRLYVHPRWAFHEPFGWMSQRQKERWREMKTLYWRAAVQWPGRARSDVPPAAVVQDPLQELRQAARHRNGLWLRKRNGKRDVYEHGRRRIIYASSMRWILA